MITATSMDHHRPSSTLSHGGFDFQRQAAKTHDGTGELAHHTYRPLASRCVPTIRTDGLNVTDDFPTGGHMYEVMMNHPWFQNPFMAPIAALSLTAICLWLIASAISGFSLNRKY